MKKRFRLLLAGVSLLSAVGAVHATSLGYDIDPLGSRDSAGVGYAFWDTFSDSSFNYTSPTESNGGTVLLASMKSDTSGALVLASGDRLYANEAAFNFTINGGNLTPVDSAVLQLKFIPSGVDPLTFFNVSLLNAAAPTVSLFNTFTEGGQTYNVVTYSWSDLGFAPGSQIQFTITSDTGSHVSLDGVSVDVAPVPEPATWLLLSAGLGTVMFVARRRRVQS